MSELSKRLRGYLGNIDDTDWPDLYFDIDLAAEIIEAGEWREWPDENGRGEYPSDEVPVEIYCGNWSNKERVIGCISKRAGTYGPSGASHWKPLLAPPEVKP